MLLPRGREGGRESEGELGRPCRLVGLTMFQAPYEDDVIKAKFLKSQYILTLDVSVHILTLQFTHYILTLRIY